MSVKLKDFEPSDIEPINVIFERQPDLGVPNLRNVIVNSTIVKGKEVIGYGVVKMYAEAVLILDQMVQKRDKGMALIHGLNLAISACSALKIEQLHIISNDENFTKVLQKRFSFKKASGTSLFLELGDRNGK